ncbi:MAG TPA: TolC family protein [Steroidobacteraceae bacterium]|nr:TolC family protein [Steroidobacteraceae bacterium]
MTPAAITSGAPWRARAASLLMGVAAGVAIAGCAVGPNYHRPEAAPVVARNLNAQQFTAAPAPADWWQQVDDPELASLEQRALAGDLDLQLALQRVRAARAVVRGTQLDYAPHIPLDAAYSHSKEQQPGFGSERYDIESYSVGFDASWELDLFGRTRRAVQAASADLGAQTANLDETRVIVAAEVARNYFQLRGTQQQLVVAHDNIDNERESLRLTQVRYEAGRVTELDVDSALARLKTTEATLPLLEAQEKSYGYRLAVLLGSSPGDLDAELIATPAHAWTEPLPIGDVTTLLRHRPDVRIAERNLAAATARVGVATAELFPRVSFTGFIGFLTGNSVQLGAAGSRAWSVGPSISWTALDFGSAQARLQVSKSEASGALASYRQAVLLALEDFENACLNYGKQQARLASVMEQTEASRRAARLAEVQYREGGINFLVLLDAQRTLLEAEDAVAQAETGVNTGAVAVYKALGGIDSPPGTTL